MTITRAPPTASAPSRVDDRPGRPRRPHDRLARTRLPRPAPGDDWDYGIPNSLPARHGRPLAHGLRLARAGGADERVPALPDRDRRPDRPLHPRAVRRAGRDAAAARPHLPRLVRRLPRHDRAADRPGRARRRAEDAFSVVVPSMPGFGFSTPLVDRGWTMARVARTFDTLMRRLGYESYGVARQRRRRDGLPRARAAEPARASSALHVLQLFSFPSGDPAEFEKLEPKDYAALEHLEWFQSVGGYNAINACRPQTVAVGVSDSPVGPARLERAVQRASATAPAWSRRDQILTEVSLDWFTNTSATRGPLPLRGGARRGRAAVNDAPTGVAVFADDFKTIRRSPSATTATSCTGASSTSGGHYAALEARRCWPATSAPSSPGCATPDAWPVSGWWARRRDGPGGRPGVGAAAGTRPCRGPGTRRAGRERPRPGPPGPARRR